MASRSCFVINYFICLFCFQLERFVELKIFIDTTNDIRVTTDQWQSIELTKKILYHPYELTLKLQRKDYTLSDFYGDWVKTKRSLQAIPHELSKQIVDNMVSREGGLLNHKLMLGAVYLDPRYNMLLSMQQKQAATVYLSGLWCRLQNIDSIETAPDTANDQENDDFAEYLASIDPLQVSENIVGRIELFIQRPSVHYKTNIIQYWHNMKAEEPDLFKIATALFSVSPAQTAVEQSFSQLKFIFNDYRTRLNMELLNQLLIIRMNYDLAKN